MRELWVPASLSLCPRRTQLYPQCCLSCGTQGYSRRLFFGQGSKFFQIPSSIRFLGRWRRLSHNFGTSFSRTLKDALEHSSWLYPGPQYTKMLTGRYEPYDSLLVVQRVKHAANPHYIDDVDLAVAARWKSFAEISIEKRARDILGRSAEANDQLPTDIPGVTHIGFEALGDDVIEQRRFERILATARNFDRGKTALEYIYCHYFAPEVSPEETWAIDETVQWIGIRETGRPLLKGSLVIPPDSNGRTGVHWVPPEYDTAMVLRPGALG